jgi:hypothetical protein
MTFAALDFPSGRPFALAAAVIRTRQLPPDAQTLVRVNELVRAEQPIAHVTLDGVPMPILAGLTGRITDTQPTGVTIEGVATLLHGVLGIGPAVAGPLVSLPRGESFAVVPIPRGGIILLPQQAPLMLLQRAVTSGAAAVIAASASARELESFARADLSLLLDGQSARAARMPLTIVLTEGLGSYAMRSDVYQALAQRVNSVVLVSGATDPRRSIRPEIALPLPSETSAQSLPLSYDIESGARVAVTAGSQWGKRGQVTHVFARQRHVEPGILTTCAVVRFEDGTTASVPTFALDRIG